MLYVLLMKLIYILFVNQGDDVDSRTMIVDDSTLVPDKSKGTSLKSNSLVEELRTMVINSDGEDDSTMKSLWNKELIDY